MSKKQCLVLCGVILVAHLASCAPAPTATPAATPAAKPAPTAAPTSQPSPTQATTAAKTIELKYSTYRPENHVLVQRVAVPLAQAIEKRSGGRVKVTMYYSETLGKAADQYDLLRKGTADIADIVSTYVPGRFPLASVIELPLLIPSVATGTESMWRMYKDGYFKSELDEVETLAISMSSPWHLLSKKPVATLNDLKGLKIRLSGGPAGKAIEAVGASPVSMGAGDMYLALDRGTIDGAIQGYTTHLSYKLQEVAKNAFEVGLASTALYIMMNKDSWAKLPKDIQDIFNNGLKEEVVRWWIVTSETDDLLGKGLLAKEGVQVRSISPVDKAKWVELSKPIFDETITAVDKKGVPGRATFDTFLKIMAQLGVRY